MYHFTEYQTLDVDAALVFFLFRLKHFQQVQRIPADPARNAESSSVPVSLFVRKKQYTVYY